MAHKPVAESVSTCQCPHRLDYLISPGREIYHLLYGAWVILLSVTVHSCRPVLSIITGAAMILAASGEIILKCRCGEAFRTH